MAAPSGIVWGSIAGSYGRIGIYVKLTNTATQTTRHTEIWFWSKYSVSDTSNTFYYNDNATSATTSMGSVSISTTVASGSGWSTSNQVKLKEYNYTYTKRTSSSKISVAAKLTGIDRVGATMTALTSYTIPALASYTVSYNANGGSGAPSSQTKWYGKTLTLSSTKPTRTGYSFQGWATSASGSVAYAAGGSYTGNSALTLYAVWKANTYTVSYNANGGSGAPGSQTKTYGVTLTLSSTKPTRTNYNFLGWGTSSSATTVSYAAGGIYTANAAITLYAIWQLAYVKPRITNMSVARCNSSGTVTEEGTYAKVVFNWATDKTVSSITVKWKAATATTWSSTTISASGTSGSVSQAVGAGGLSTDSTYDIQIVVADASGSTTVSRSLPGLKFTIDCLAGGNGVAFGKPAETSNLFEVNFPAQFNNYAKFKDNINLNGLRQYTGEIGNATGTTVWFKLGVIANSWDSCNHVFKIYSGSGYNASANQNTWLEVVVKDGWQQTLSTTSSFGAYCLVHGQYDTNVKVGVYALTYNSFELWVYLPWTYWNGRYEVYTQGAWTHDGSSSSEISSTGVSQNLIVAQDLNSANYNNYALPLTGGNVSGTANVSGISAFNWVRFNNSWVGFYGSHANAINGTSRLGWIGHDATTHLKITNEAGGNIILKSTNAQIDLTCKSCTVTLDYSGGGTYNGYFIPATTAKTTLGTTNYRWYGLYSSQACNTSSDERLKSNIIPMNSELATFLSGDNSNIFENIFSLLKPVAFSSNVEDGTEHEGRMHFGFIAQEVEKALEENGLDEKAASFVTHSFWTDEETGEEKDEYSLRYEEFIALNTHMIQTQQKEIESLKSTVENQQKEINELKELVNRLLESA